MCFFLFVFFFGVGWGVDNEDIFLISYVCMAWSKEECITFRERPGEDFMKGLNLVSGSNLRLLSQIIGTFYLNPWAQP